MTMDIFGMMAELAADGVASDLQCRALAAACQTWAAHIVGEEDSGYRRTWAGYGATPEEAWRKACDAWDREPNKERYRQHVKVKEDAADNLATMEPGRIFYEQTKAIAEGRHPLDVAEDMLRATEGCGPRMESVRIFTQDMDTAVRSTCPSCKAVGAYYTFAKAGAFKCFACGAGGKLPPT